MKVCMVLGGYFGYGGIQTTVSDLTRELARRGHEVRLLCMGVERPVPDGVIVDVIPRPFTKNVYSRVKGLYRSGAIDIVHAVGCAGINLMPGKLLNGIPFVLTLHSTAVSEYLASDRSLSEKQMYLRFYMQECLPAHFADRIICISNYTRDRVHKDYFVKMGRMKTIYIGIDAVKFQNRSAVPRDDHKILMVGRIDPRKGYLEFLEQVAPAIAVQCPGVEIEIVGERSDFYRSYGEKLDQAVEKNGLAGVVKFAGKVSFEELVEKYWTSSLFIHASKEEGFGIALIEAQLCGLPVIAFNTSAIKETVIDKKSGCLVESHDEIVARARELMASPDLRARMGASGIEFARAFSWDTIVQQYIEEYESLRSKPR